MADATLFDFILVSYITFVYEYIRHTAHYFCLGFVLWIYLQDNWKLACRGAELLWLFLGLKSEEELCLAPNETRTHVSQSLTSVAVMAQYLNVRQRKWGTIIIQIVHILQLDNADIGSLPMVDFFKHIPNYFQITQPGSSTVTPPYQWRRLKSWKMKVMQQKYCKIA